MGLDVVVVGSLNRDVTVLTPRYPKPGETVIGTAHFVGSGGKGANQAVAAARLGARVGMVGLVGADEAGVSLVAGLAAEGVDVTAIGVDRDAETGMAMIVVDQTAENGIVVSPGANMRLSVENVEAHQEMIAGAGVVLAQLEVPVATLTAVARIAIGWFCLNPAPAQLLPPELLDRVDVLVPNRSELAILTSEVEPTTTEEAVRLARQLGQRSAVVVTMGASGAALVRGDEVALTSAPDVDAVDTTGAGDAFCGALAVALSRGEGLETAVRWACAAGAISVTKLGAQSALPTLDEVEALIDG